MYSTGLIDYISNKNAVRRVVKPDKNYQKYVLHMPSFRTYSTSPSRGYLVGGLPRAASFEIIKNIQKS